MEHEKSAMQPCARVKQAELMSSLGAGLLGFGLGAMVAPFVADLALLVLVAGALMHGWGMYNKHANERALGQAETLWMKALYWLCWLILAGLAAMLITRLFL
jgi:uncharacterized membrane protein YecN with MAPEG domain